MGQLDALIPQVEAVRDDRSAPLMAGTVIDDATGVNDLIRVRLDVDRDLYVGPMPFQPRVKKGGSTHGTLHLALVLPDKGDRALVAFDETLTPTLVWWGRGVGTADPGEADGVALATQEALDAAAATAAANLAAAVTTLTTLEAWTNATYQNGWATESGSTAAGYYKHDSRVYLRGIMNGASATAVTAFTLPTGYRPGHYGSWPLSYWDGAKQVAGTVDVATDGTVQIYDNTGSAGVAANVTNVALDVVNFRVA